MFTRKEFDEAVDNLNEKAKYIAESLESLWQYVHKLSTEEKSEKFRETLCDIGRRIESVQFDDYANPSMMESKMRFRKFYEILEENEKTKDLDKFIKYERFVKNIQKMTKEFEDEDQ